MRIFTIIIVLFTFQGQTKTINLSISNEGKFDVNYHRFASTNYGAIIGGLVGASIDSGIRKGKDTKKKNELLKTLSDSTCKTRLVEQFVNKLINNEFTVVLEQSNKKNKKSTFWLDINIIKCGYKMVNSSTEEMSAYVEFKTVIRTNNKVVTKKKYSIKAKKQYNYQKLVKDTQIINTELGLVLIKAGKRLANKIIYQ